VKQELVGHDGLEVTIVWSPMMDADDEGAAREAATIFAGSHVVHFYDPERRVGSAFRRDVFPKAYEQALATLPSDHWLHDALVEKGPAYGDRPEWDIYMFFDAGAKWIDAPPRPAHFVRHMGRIIETDDGRLSLMWIDDYGKPPVEGVLAEEIGRLEGRVPR
jgi:hypothetical protein